MPQTTVLSQWKAEYPMQAPFLQPGGDIVTKTGVATAAAWLTGTTTFTVPAHGITVGTPVWITTGGFAPAGYNGQFWAVAASATTFTVPMANPGTQTALGSVYYMTLVAGAVPNKPQWTGTFFSASASADIPEEERSLLQKVIDARQAVREAVVEAVTGEDPPPSPPQPSHKTTKKH
jgi:hypothetical protein